MIFTLAIYDIFLGTNGSIYPWATFANKLHAAMCVFHEAIGIPQIGFGT